jgi:hypothetical protein
MKYCWAYQAKDSKPLEFLLLYQNIVPSLTFPTNWQFLKFLIASYFDILMFIMTLDNRILSNEISKKDIEPNGTGGQDMEYDILECEKRPTYPSLPQF